MPVKFCPLASGSSGNSVYIGYNNTHILIDAGISAKRIQEKLEEINLSVTDLSAIFITHEHSDHIKGIGTLSRRYGVPIYTTSKTWDYIDRHNAIGNILPNNKCFVYAGEKLLLDDITVKPFSIPHDAAEPVGYSIFAENYKISVATDIGIPTDIIKENIYDSDVLLLESNHDLEMLKNGSYPAYLKNRILSNVGHLSNVASGQLISEIMSSRLKHIFLGHLSEENNRPLIALDTVQNIMLANKIEVGKTTKLHIASREYISDVLVI